MAGSLGSLTGSLALDSAAFIRDLGKAAAAVDRNAAAMQRSMSNVEKGFAAATSLVKGFLAATVVKRIIDDFGELGRKAIDTADAIGAASTAIGVSAEELQRFRFAADQADVSAESLDNALKIFQKNLATGKAQFSGFDDFIKQIAEAPNQIEKVRIAQEGLGKQFQTGLLLAAQGGEEFRKQYQAAFVISEAAIQKASDLDNQMKALDNAITTGFNEGFINNFTGALDGSNKKLVELNASMRILGGLAASAFANSLNWMAKTAIFITEHPYLFLPDPTQLINHTPTARGGGRFANFASPIAPPGHAANVAHGGDSVMRINGETEALKQNADAWRASTDAIGDWDTKTTDALGRSLEFEDLQKEGTQLFAQMQTPLEEYTSGIERLNVLLEAGTISMETFQRAHTQAVVQLVSTYLDAIGQATGALAGAFKENKAIQIANAVVNTAAGIVKALGDPKLPFPLDFAVAASIAAAGAAQIATIMAAEPGSGKSPSLGSGKSAASGIDRTQANNGTGTPQQVVTINIEGDVFGPEHFRKIVDGINGVQRDGTMLLQMG